MGRYKIEITGLGDHRGQILQEATALVKKWGSQVDHAVLAHWPDTTYTVYDDLLNDHMVGQFSDASDAEKARAGVVEEAPVEEAPAEAAAPEEITPATEPDAPKDLDDATF